LLSGVDFLGRGQHRIFMGPRNHQDTIGISTQDVAGRHAGVADVDDTVHRLDLYAILAGTHRITPAENRIPKLACEAGIATGAVDDGSGDAPPGRHPGQDVTPHGRVLTAAVVEHDDAARLDLVDVVADRPGRGG